MVFSQLTFHGSSASAVVPESGVFSAILRVASYRHPGASGDKSVTSVVAAQSGGHREPAKRGHGVIPARRAAPSSICQRHQSTHRGVFSRYLSGQVEQASVILSLASSTLS